MYKRLAKQDSRWGVFEMMKEQLFCILYPTLRRISREFDELTPAEMWYEALAFANRLKRMPRPDMMREELEEMLHDEYICFETDGGIVERSEEQAKRTTFLVMVTMLYMLATENKRLQDDRYKPHCLMLAEATQDHELRQRFIDEVRETETLEELLGRRVEMVKMELEAEPDGDGLTRTKIVNDLVDCALKYDEETIKSQILVVSDLNDQYNGEFVKQMQRLKGALKKLVKSAHDGEAVQEQTEVLKRVANKPRTQINTTIELVQKKETNIGTNYGPNIEHNGGTLTLPNKDDK
jgi:hypothetical protein